MIQTDYSTGGGGARMMSPNGEVFPPSPFVATKQYMGVAGKGYATIQYANPDHILRKPLIVAEGFDPGYITEPEEKFGEISLKDFLKSVTQSGSNNLMTLIGTTSQYDIIYVDWKNGTDYLQRNAYLLETIIQWVNANKQPVSGVMQPNVVLGQSMGGVIARYALKDMENTGINHQTRLYISDDAPHQGANVPEGYQHLARHARGLYIRAGVSTIIVELIQLIRGRESPLAALSIADQPASKQMLINYVNGYNTIDNSVHTAWETELKNLGYPQGYPGITFKKVAVSNGSECGQPQPFNAADNLLTYSGKANTRILGDFLGIAGLPIAGALAGQPLLFLGIIPGRNDFNFDFYVNAQADGYSNQIYHGEITYTKKILWLVPVTVTLTNRNYSSNASTLPYDYFPGGYYDLRDANVNLKDKNVQNFLYKYNITANEQPTFCFVPTASALDIGSNNVTLTKTDYLRSYVGAFPPSAPKNTPFQNFITAYFNGKINEHHISIETRNGDWIAAELNSMPQTANCSSLCGNITLSGPGGLCTPSTYSISGFSGDATYSWLASPLGVVTITPIGNGSQATISKIKNGIDTIFVTITSSCGGFLQEFLPIVVGAPVITSINSSMTGGCNGLYQEWNLSAVANTTVSSWSWTVDNPANNNWIIYSPYSPNTVVGVTGGGGISLSATNGCGTGKDGVTIWSNCHYGAVTASPNPTTGDVSVELAQPTAQPSVETKTNATSSNTKQPMIYQIIVTDQLGNLKKQYKYSAGISNAKVSLSGLASGMYIIQAFDGVLWNSVKVIKE
ncbi:MAG: T9SS type A sorting domain-containing protein [Ginsengibacter sp.]